MEKFRGSDFSTPVQFEAGARGTEGDEIHLLETVFSEMSMRIGEQIKELKDKDRLRRELVSNISHDLRTPLASLQGYVETLDTRSHRLSPLEKKEILDKAVRLISRLGKLVAELLELARLDSLDLIAEKEPFPIADLLNDILMDIMELAAQKGIAMETAIEENTGLVNGDIRLLERAIQNILDNALKFTPTGGRINIEVSETGRTIRLTVSDTGPGISPGDLPHIFERFYRADSSGTEGGIGLGLAIAQRIAELHNTQIIALNIPEGGAAFTLDLEKWPQDDT